MVVVASELSREARPRFTALAWGANESFRVITGGMVGLM